MSVLLREKAFTSALCFIHGQRVEASGSEKLPVTSPATGKTLVESHCASAGDVDKAVQSCKAAFTEWSNISALERSKLLTLAAQKVRELIDEIAWLDVSDTGKPIWEAKGDVAGCADIIEYYAGLAPSVVGKTFFTNLIGVRLIMKSLKVSM